MEPFKSTEKCKKGVPLGLMKLQNIKKLRDPFGDKKKRKVAQYRSNS